MSPGSLRCCTHNFEHKAVKFEHTTVLSLALYRQKRQKFRQEIISVGEHILLTCIPHVQSTIFFYLYQGSPSDDPSDLDGSVSRRSRDPGSIFIELTHYIPISIYILPLICRHILFPFLLAVSHEQDFTRRGATDPVGCSSDGGESACGGRRKGWRECPRCCETG